MGEPNTVSVFVVAFSFYVAEASPMQQHLVVVATAVTVVSSAISLVRRPQPFWDVYSPATVRM